MKTSTLFSKIIITVVFICSILFICNTIILYYGVEKTPKFGYSFGEILSQDDIVEKKYSEYTKYGFLKYKVKNKTQNEYFQDIMIDTGHNNKIFKISIISKPLNSETCDLVKDKFESEYSKEKEVYNFFSCKQDLDDKESLNLVFTDARTLSQVKKESREENKHIVNTFDYNIN